MKFGLFAINTGPCSDPVTAVRVAQAAEDAGFESVWTGDHIVLPDPQVPVSPVPQASSAAWADRQRAGVPLLQRLRVAPGIRERA